MRGRSSGFGTRSLCSSGSSTSCSSCSCALFVSSTLWSFIGKAGEKAYKKVAEFSRENERVFDDLKNFKSVETWSWGKEIVGRGNFAHSLLCSGIGNRTTSFNCLNPNDIMFGGL